MAVLTAVALIATAAGAKASARTLTKTAHAPFGSCASHDISVRVTVPRLTYTPTQHGTITAVITNTGTTPCTYLGTNRPTQLIGPCGTIPYEVDNRNGVRVWPSGVQNYMCTLQVGHTLLPGASVNAAGAWDQFMYHASHGPRGTYELVVDRTIRFRLVLT